MKDLTTGYIDEICLLKWQKFALVATILNFSSMFCFKNSKECGQLETCWWPVGYMLPTVAGS